MSLKQKAKETLDLLESGEFTSPTGETFTFRKEQKKAEQETKLYRPEEGLALLHAETPQSTGKPKIEVTDETTQKAAYRLAVTEGLDDVLLLNFASARNPGGGFLNGAKAQEEDLTRCSGLYPTLLTQMEYYEYNRNRDTMLYSDHMIYSPNVPWFRSRSRDLPNTLFYASVITAPAPNAGQHIRKMPDQRDLIEPVLRQRAEIIVAVARENGHRNIILGAWGCGVFMNDPAMVADAFGTVLEKPDYSGAFDRVVFAIYGGKRNQTLEAFQERFA